MPHGLTLAHTPARPTSEAIFQKPSPFPSPAPMALMPPPASEGGASWGCRAALLLGRASPADSGTRASPLDRSPKQIPLLRSCSVCVPVQAEVVESRLGSPGCGHVWIRCPARAGPGPALLSALLYGRRAAENSSNHSRQINLCAWELRNNLFIRK